MSNTRTRRMTRQKQTILEVLRASTSHPTADEIYTEVRDKLPRISLGTVYRNLQTLAEDGEIRTLNDGIRTRFDGTLHKHYHVRCLVCGSVGDVSLQAAGQLKSGTKREDIEYRIVGYKIEFVGICPDCEHKGEEVDTEQNSLSGYQLVKN